MADDRDHQDHGITEFQIFCIACEFCNTVIKSNIDVIYALARELNPDSRRNGLISTTGSKAYLTGDEHPQLRTAIAWTPALPYFYF